MGNCILACQFGYPDLTAWVSFKCKHDASIVDARYYNNGQYDIYPTSSQNRIDVKDLVSDFIGGFWYIEDPAYLNTWEIKSRHFSNIKPLVDSSKNYFCWSTFATCGYKYSFVQNFNYDYYKNSQWYKTYTNKLSIINGTIYKWYQDGNYIGDAPYVTIEQTWGRSYGDVVYENTLIVYWTCYEQPYTSQKNGLVFDFGYWQPNVQNPDGTDFYSCQSLWLKSNRWFNYAYVPMNNIFHPSNNADQVWHIYIYFDIEEQSVYGHIYDHTNGVEIWDGELVFSGNASLPLAKNYEFEYFSENDVDSEYSIKGVYCIVDKSNQVDYPAIFEAHGWRELDNPPVSIDTLNNYYHDKYFKGYYKTFTRHVVEVEYPAEGFIVINYPYNPYRSVLIKIIDNFDIENVRYIKIEGKGQFAVSLVKRISSDGIYEVFFKSIQRFSVTENTKVILFNSKNNIANKVIYIS